MPFIQPSRGDVHVNAPLTNIAIAFFQNQSNFIADSVFPNIPVSKQSDVFFTIPRGEFNRDQMKERAPGAPAAEITHKVSTDNYFAHTYALKQQIADMVRANADAPLNLDRQVTEQLTLQALINRENKWTSNFFAGTIWSNDWDGVAASPSGNQVLQWNDAASTPIEDVHYAKTVVLSNTGFEPNTLVLGYEVFNKLIDHPDVIDRIKYGQTAGSPAMANENTLAQLFGVSRVLVMKAIQNTAAEGATDVHTFIGGKKALLCYVPPNPGIYIPSAGYTFSWNGYLGASPNGMRVKRYYSEVLESDTIEIQAAYVHKLIAADLGFFWDTIVA